MRKKLQDKSKVSSCEMAKSIYLHNIKIKEEKDEKENAARIAAAIKHFTKIFPDIKHNKEKDVFELCGYNFEYGYRTINQRTIHNSSWAYQSLNKIKSGQSMEKDGKFRLVLCGNYSQEKGDKFIYNIEDLGEFLVTQEQFKKEEENRVEIKRAGNTSFWGKIKQMLIKFRP